MFAVTAPWDVEYRYKTQCEQTLGREIWQKGMNGPAVVTDSVPCFHSVECDRTHHLGMVLLTQRGFYRTVPTGDSSPPPALLF